MVYNSGLHPTLSSERMMPFLEREVKYYFMQTQTSCCTSTEAEQM